MISGETTDHLGGNADEVVTLEHYPPEVRRLLLQDRIRVLEAEIRNEYATERELPFFRAVCRDRLALLNRNLTQCREMLEQIDRL